jgi:hypothetical protein
MLQIGQSPEALNRSGVTLSRTSCAVVAVSIPVAGLEHREHDEIVPSRRLRGPRN